MAESRCCAIFLTMSAFASFVCSSNTDMALDPNLELFTSCAMQSCAFASVCHSVIHNAKLGRKMSTGSCCLSPCPSLRELRHRPVSHLSRAESRSQHHNRDSRCWNHPFREAHSMATENADNQRDELVVLVTGANRGLGLAISELLGREGHTVIMTCRDQESGRRAVDELSSRGANVLYRPLDVTNAEEIKLLKADLTANNLIPQIIFNNAGVCLKGTSKEVLKTTLDVNFFGPLQMIMTFVESMKANHGSATIINISSGDGELAFLNSELQGSLLKAAAVEEIALLLRNIIDQDAGTVGELAFGPTPAYCLSKAALNALTRVLGSEAATSGAEPLRVIAVCPGDVRTAMCTCADPAEALAPADAAMAVVRAAMRAQACPSGGFYRAGEAIPW